MVVPNYAKLVNIGAKEASLLFSSKNNSEEGLQNSASTNETFIEHRARLHAV